MAELKRVDDSWVLTLYKKMSSKQAAKTLGIKKHKQKIIDSSLNEIDEYEYIFRRRLASADNLPLRLESNMMRILIEDRMDIKIPYIVVVIETKIDFTRGITRKKYYIDIERVDFEDVFKNLSGRSQNVIKEELKD